MKLVERFAALARELPDDWSEARLLVTVGDDARCDRAAALLGPANPGRLGKTITLSVGRRGSGVGVDGLKRLVRRLDEERIDGDIQLVRIDRLGEQAMRPSRSLHGEWERSVATLPPDWSDVYAEVRLDSTDYVERAALLMAPLNPARFTAPTALRFRCARRFGYGASPEMVSRCLQRCDDEAITGSVEILYALSDTYPAATQGPVWYVGGRLV